MELKEWMKRHLTSEKEKLAADCKTTVAYLYQVAGGHRSASGKLAKAIEQYSNGLIDKSTLRPDLWDKSH